ncbi:hypothetical protein [Rhodococcus wratislaviensis]|uniref:Uncharacterized protein n=1 Tax=Rhodococcus wratislaviensis NBRC 100605 TaxID=1219028 RepID=X0Q0C0_RHOWR|nr:hypothetical protein [Rhodococcus wratislaviensis]GAF43566.1 hypothetical protein RW1_007_02310 [Rhodococcus wratislaviensis NBRC 100605]
MKGSAWSTTGEFTTTVPISIHYQTAQLRAEAAIVLEEVGSVAPVAIEGGAAIAALTGIFGRLAENAGKLVIDLDRAGTALRDAMEP